MVSLRGLLVTLLFSHVSLLIDAHIQHTVEHFSATIEIKINK